MQTVRKATARSVCRPRLQTQSRQRRWASHETKHDHHASPNESFGPGFFIGLLCIPAAIGVYTISRPGKDGEQPYFSRLITSAYADYAKKNEERNILHTDMMEQAAADRTLFLSHRGLSVKHVELRFPEQFNGGAPHNIPAGHGSANIDAVIQKYQKEAYEANERKLQQIRDNAVPAEQPLKTSMPKDTPGIADS